MSGIAARIRALLGLRGAREEIDDEIAFHLAMETRRLVERGMDADAARTAATHRLGDLTHVRAECTALTQEMETEMRRVEWLEEVKQDVVFGVRLLRRAPLFTAMALLTLAIGVGATTSIFSVVEAVLLRGLPYPNAPRLVVISNGTGVAKSERSSVAPPEYADYLAQSRAFDGIAAVRVVSATLAGGCAAASACEPEQVVQHAVTPNFWRVLGIGPSVGRDFSPDDGIDGAPGTVVLSHAFWRRRYGGDSAVLGRTLTISGRARTIIGVLPEEVAFPDAPISYLHERADVFTPLSWDKRADDRGNQYLAVIGKLRAGMTLVDGRRDLDAIAENFRNAFPDRYRRNPKWRLIGVPLVDDMIGDSRAMLFTLFAAVAVILLIASANIANLILARGATRERELAVRAALGARRGRIVRQLLVENLLLALTGGALGIAVAYVTIPRLIALDPGTIPRFQNAEINGVVLVFSLAVSVVVGLLFGIGPAMRFSSTDVRGRLRDGTRTTRAPRRRVRSLLVVAEMTLALMVLVVSGLLVRTVAAIGRVPTGIAAASAQTFLISLPGVRYDSAYKRAAAHQRVLDALRATPGVTDASGVYPLPMSGDGWSGSYHVEGEPDNGTEAPHAEMSVSMPGYPKTIGIPLREGRDFANTDVRESPLVAIVDEDLARRHWPGASAIGKRISTNSSNGPWAEIVGVVGHVRRAGPLTESEPQIYLPALQRPQAPMYYVARTNDPSTLGNALRAAVSSVDRDLPLAKLRSMDAVVESAIARQRFNMVLFTCFGLTALALAAAGLYGVMGYLVTQREQEIGVRLALGGSRRDVLRMILAEGMTMAGVGVGLGLIGAVFAARLVAGLLYGVGGIDAVTYGAISVILLVVAFIATAGPALRATRIDPMEAMRR